MTKITITIKSKPVTITQIFDEKKLGSARNVMKAALEWLVMGTEFEIRPKEIKPE